MLCPPFCAGSASCQVRDPVMLLDEVDKMARDGARGTLERAPGGEERGGTGHQKDVGSLWAITTNNLQATLMSAGSCW